VRDTFKVRAFIHSFIVFIRHPT